MKTKIEYLGVDAPTLSANPISKVKAIASSPESCVIAAATCMSCLSLLKVHVSTLCPDRMLFPISYDLCQLPPDTFVGSCRVRVFLDK